MKEKDVEELLSEQDEEVAKSDKLEPSSENKIVGNYSGYGYKGSENFEHDDTGSQHNYSGAEDEMNSALAEHEDWTEGYDY